MSPIYNDPVVTVIVFIKNQSLFYRESTVLIIRFEDPFPDELQAAPADLYSAQILSPPCLRSSTSTTFTLWTTLPLFSRANCSLKPWELLFDIPLQQWLPYALGLLIGYPLLTNSLRYRRMHNLQKKYNYPTRESMTKMTDEEAFVLFPVMRVISIILLGTVFRILDRSILRGRGRRLLSRLIELDAEGDRCDEYSGIYALLLELLCICL